MGRVSEEWLVIAYRFEGECKKKYCGRTYDIFSKLFNHLPLGFIINSKV